MKKNITDVRKVPLICLFLLTLMFEVYYCILAVLTKESISYLELFEEGLRIIIVVLIFTCYGKRSENTVLFGLVASAMMLLVLSQAEKVLGEIVGTNLDDYLVMGLSGSIYLFANWLYLIACVLIFALHLFLGTADKNILTIYAINKVSLTLAIVPAVIYMIACRTSGEGFGQSTVNTVSILSDVAIMGLCVYCEHYMYRKRINSAMHELSDREKDLRLNIKGAVWYEIALAFAVVGIVLIALLNDYQKPFIAVLALPVLVSVAYEIYFASSDIKAFNPKFNGLRNVSAVICMAVCLFGMAGAIYAIAAQYHGEIKSTIIVPINYLKENGFPGFSEDKSNVYETDDLYIIFPEYNTIELAVKDQPKKSDESITFLGSGPFHNRISPFFKEDEIVGPYAINGEYFEGGEAKGEYGALTFYDGEFHIIKENPEEAIKEAAKHGGSGYEQYLIVKDGVSNDVYSRKCRCYRVIAELKGYLCIIDSKQQMYFDDFTDQLIALGVKDAVYCDMGGMSSYSWFRDTNPEFSTFGKIIKLFSVPSPVFKSWIVFRK